jgi:peptide deformylase
VSILSIYVFGTEVLRRKAKAVRSVDNEIITLVYDMFDTMRNANGIGLAANQVGVLQRIITIDISDTEEGKRTKPLVLINPEILREEGELVMEEGCLSVPEIREEVARPESIRLRFRDINFHEHEIDANGLLARVILHEMDHLDGILFTDHLNATKRRQMKGKFAKIKKGEAETIYPVTTGIKL